MRRYGNLWDKILSVENALLAIKKASRRTGRISPHKREAIRKVKENPEEHAKRLVELLGSGNYRTGKYFVYPLFEPKLRLIYCLSFWPDRIVHHMLMNVLEPIWENQMIHDSYACRIGKGQHRGSQRAGDFVRKFKYCLQCDISQFYISLDHIILKEIIRKKLKDPHVLNVLDGIIDSISARDKNLSLD